MAGRLAQDWLAYIVMAGILWFFIYVFIHSRQQEKKNKEQNKSQKEK